MPTTETAAPRRPLPWWISGTLQGAAAGFVVGVILFVLHHLQWVARP